MRLLDRHRSLLWMIRSHGGSISRLRLVKLMFLLREEVRDSTVKLYDFVPYHYGPFSFTLYRDVGVLVNEGLLHETTPRTWTISQGCIVDETQPKLAIKRAVEAVADRFSSCTTSELLSLIYNAYPWYASRSRSIAPGGSPDSSREPTILTAGLAGESVDSWIERLLRNQVQVVIDVRFNPVSRTYGFHKTRLRHLLSRVGIRYEHRPELGIDSSTRARFPSQHDRRALLDDYESELRRDKSVAIGELATQMKILPSVLVCQERDPEECHRSRLAEAVSEIAELPVEHLVE